MTRRTSLFARTLVTVAAGLLVSQWIAAAAIFIYLVLPLAQRSADDLADFLTLSARQWTQLSAKSRDAFERDLKKNHGVELMEARTIHGSPYAGFAPYATFLAEALDSRLASGQTSHVEENAQEQFVVEFNEAGHAFHFEFALSKMSPRPIRALGWGLLAARLASIALAWMLASRVLAPIRMLSDAAMKIADAEDPPLLPERGEREFAELARVFNDMSQQLQARRDNQSTLLAGVSHDLRSPLARMKMSIGMLSAQFESPLLERVERDIAEMDRLIGAQLELARAQEREAAEPVNLQSLMEDLFEAAEAQLPGRVHLQMRRLRGPFALAPLAFRRTVGNLLDNALRYAGDGPIELVGRRLKGNLCIAVRDRGPGIPPHLRQAVFQPFYRLDSSRSRASGGSGLGLAIARQLAETQGWRLGYRSRRGGGASAWLLIPV